MSSLVVGERDVSVGRRKRRVRREVASAEETRAVTWLLGLTVLGSALWIGAVHTRVMLGIAGLLLAIYGFAIWRGVVGRRLPGPAIGLAILGAYCLLQATPLPMQLLGPLAKGNFEIWSGLFEVLGERTPLALPLSLDPGASRLEAVRWTSYAVAFALSAGLGARERAVTGPFIVHFSAL